MNITHTHIYIYIYCWSYFFLRLSNKMMQQVGCWELAIFWVNPKAEWVVIMIQLYIKSIKNKVSDQHMISHNLFRFAVFLLIFHVLLASITVLVSASKMAIPTRSPRFSIVLPDPHGQVLGGLRSGLTGGVFSTIWGIGTWPVFWNGKKNPGCNGISMDSIMG